MDNYYIISLDNWGSYLFIYPLTLTDVASIAIGGQRNDSPVGDKMTLGLCNKLVVTTKCFTTQSALRTL
jgi:hypothetical protein